MAPASIEELTHTYLEAIERELQRAVKRADVAANSWLYEMLAYHMGWENNPGTSLARGKRFRPLLVLLCCTAAGGEWQYALPGAAAVELVHNFSLIHDDIEDNSPLRRGRTTLWKKWGIPQATNSGDAMLALAHLEAIRLSQSLPPSITLKAVELLQATCLRLTQGQFFDLSFESRNDVSLEDYWRMVEGKTAALISASAELGALAAHGDDHTCLLFRKFGHALGLAFQVQDDWLGIWGNTSLTGKSSQSDLLARKITLPVLYGLSLGQDFSQHWKRGPILPEQLGEVIRQLELEGVKKFTEDQAQRLIDEALETLAQAHAQETAADALKHLALSLVNRQA